MKIVSLLDFQEMTQDAVSLARDSYGEKVLLGRDNKIYKIFRRKRLLSSALFVPYAVRFCKNAQRLKKSGIPTVDVERIFYIPGWKRHVVVYPALSGMTLREKLKQETNCEKGIRLFLEMLCQLHLKGIYYRSLHFGNLFLKDDGVMALIDVSDMSFRPWALWLLERAKNFRHFLRYSEDIASLKQYGFSRFIEEYMDISGFSLSQRKRFTIMLKRFYVEFGM